MIEVKEQRRTKRTDVKWPVSIWHPKASRFYNGRSVNLSGKGALVELPMKVPVKVGQTVEINIPRNEELSREKGQSARIKKARVIYVNRNESLETTHIKVGFQFDE